MTDEPLLTLSETHRILATLGEDTDRPVQEPKAFLQLGRYGDIALMGPVFKYYADLTGSPTIVASSAQFGSILEGMSYVTPYIFPEKYSWHHNAGECLAMAQKEFPDIVRTQLHGVGWHTPPDSLPSYSISMWARAGLTLEDYKRLPLVFDRRDAEREKVLVKTWRKTNKPLLLLNFKGATSPMEEGEGRALSAMAKLWPLFETVNLAEIKAHRIYDLLGLFDQAAGLVTIDTASIHVAAASDVECINFVRDDGQAGSIPKNNARLTIGYNRCNHMIDEMLAVVESWAK